MLARAGGRRLPIVPVKRATLKTRANAVSVARANERLDPLANQVTPHPPDRSSPRVHTSAGGTSLHRPESLT